MKHRNVKIKTVKYLDSIDIGRYEDTPVKPIFKTGYSPIGMNYPMTIEECKLCIDNLIETVMTTVGVTEDQAVKLINDN